MIMRGTTKPNAAVKLKLIWPKITLNNIFDEICHILKNLKCQTMINKSFSKITKYIHCPIQEISKAIIQQLVDMFSRQWQFHLIISKNVDNSRL